MNENIVLVPLPLFPLTKQLFALLLLFFQNGSGITMVSSILNIKAIEFCIFVVICMRHITI